MKLTAVIFLWFAISAAAQADQLHDEVSSATDAKGIRHVMRAPGPMPPWIADAVFRPKPDYPYKERSHGNEGRAVIRLEIDLKTGSVTNAVLVQSSGFTALDEAALNGLRKWRWRPGKWKEVEIPVSFTMSARYR